MSESKGFPSLKPATAPAPQRELATVAGEYTHRSVAPKTPERQRDKSISIDETAFLLDKNLMPIHREDPNVIRFIKNYLACRSVAQAARESGLTPRDGHNLKNRRDIHAAIVAITDVAVLRHGYDAGEVVERVKEIAAFDPGDLENEDGTFRKHMKEIPAEARRALKSLKVKNFYETDPNGIEVKKGEIIEYTFWDKMKGLELLGREKDIFKETKKVEHSMGANGRDFLLESRERAVDAEKERAVEIAYTEIKE